MTRPAYPSVDESFDRLHRAGWSIGHVGKVAHETLRRTLEKTN